MIIMSIILIHYYLLTSLSISAISLKKFCERNLQIITTNYSLSCLFKRNMYACCHKPLCWASLIEQRG